MRFAFPRSLAFEVFNFPDSEACALPRSLITPGVQDEWDLPPALAYGELPTLCIGNCDKARHS